ncbi:MAG TPA: hypothetical protein VGS96_02240 [Thermoanaerobaculia bacterium]|jgi:hypothetical protein|nr:hypothetical protein [Thermoanaerobaculia bacterium]
MKIRLMSVLVDDQDKALEFSRDPLATFASDDVLQKEYERLSKLGGSVSHQADEDGTDDDRSLRRYLRQSDPDLSGLIE